VSADRALVAELVRLRRGWGLQHRNLRTRIGDQLTQRCRIDAGDGDREIREKIRSWLGHLIADLPPELARTTLVAYALTRSHQHRQLTRRLESLAAELSWAPRTARRRMDHALALVTQAALKQPGGEAGIDATAAPRTTTLVAVVQLEPTSQTDADVLVMRVPVPTARFDLLISFDPGSAQ
jgi:hypothetical protein